MEIRFHGACREVGRAGILIEEKNKRVLLDYGVKVSEEKNVLPLPVQGFLDAVIVSHAHLDHSGALPTLYQGSEQPLFMTPPSLPMIDLLVEDTIKIHQMKGIRPIFSHQHVKRMKRSTVPVGYGRKTSPCSDIHFTFHDAGHILGAASIELNTKDYNLVYTGDIKFEDTRLHSAAYDKFKNTDILITESTYGDREHPNRKELEEKFTEACWETCDGNGNVLVPAFAVGRSQEIIEILNANKFEYPIYMDGMSKAAAEIMIQHQDYLRDYNEFYRAMKECEWVDSTRQRKEALSKPSVIVSTAGMLTGGPAINYLFKMKELSAKKPMSVFFSGYQPEKTPGYHLLNTKRLKYESFDLNYSNFDIQHFDFSAHSDKNELMKFAEKVKPKLCFVEHGEEKQSVALAERIEEKVGCRAIVPKFGDRYKIENYI